MSVEAPKLVVVDRRVDIPEHLSEIELDRLTGAQLYNAVSFDTFGLRLSELSVDDISLLFFASYNFFVL